LLSAWFSIATAVAAPVLYDTGSATDAKALVYKATGENADPAIDLRIMRAKGPTVLGEGRLRACTLGAATNFDIDTEYHRAAGAFAHLDSATTIEAADLAVAKLGCLTEPADPVVVGKLFLLRGVMEADRNRETVARDELRTAWSFAPDQKWDDSYPPTAQPWFEEERVAKMPYAITLAPRAPEPDGPWLDGHPLPSGAGSVGSGLHLVQYVVGTRTLTTWVVVAGDALVVDADAYPERALSLIADETRRDTLGPLLRSSFPAGPVWLVSDGWVVEGTVAADAVTFTVRATPPPPVDEDEKKRKGKKK
jgi:hypothetical protein